MTSKSHLTRCATLALAASLALGSTPLLAQDVAAPPVTTAPVSVAPPSATIIVPDVAPASQPAPAPTVAIPEATPPEAAAPTAATPATPQAETTRSTPARAVADRAAPVARAPELTTPVEASAEDPVDPSAVEIAPLSPPVAAAPEQTPELAPVPAETRTADNTMAVVLGILAALALIVIGFFALRRKGPKHYAAAEPGIENPMPAGTQPLPQATAAPEFPAGREPEKVVTPSAPSVAYTGATFGAARPATGLSHAGAAVALPRELPASYEEREALLKRMAEAKPDRANPFRSKRARYRRARLILASLHRDFKDTDPWIDLSQYPSNWPEFARRQSVAA